MLTEYGRQVADNLLMDFISKVRAVKISTNIADKIILVGSDNVTKEIKENEALFKIKAEFDTDCIIEAVSLIDSQGLSIFAEYLQPIHFHPGDTIEIYYTIQP